MQSIPNRVFKSFRSTESKTEFAWEGESINYLGRIFGKENNNYNWYTLETNLADIPLNNRYYFCKDEISNNYMFVKSPENISALYTTSEQQYTPVLSNAISSIYVNFKNEQEDVVQFKCDSLKIGNIVPATSRPQEIVTAWKNFGIDCTGTYTNYVYGDDTYTNYYIDEINIVFSENVTNDIFQTLFKQGLNYSSISLRSAGGGAPVLNNVIDISCNAENDTPFQLVIKFDTFKSTCNPRTLFTSYASHDNTENAYFGLVI